MSMGCYAQMNGYRSRVFEMHDKPGGLCTAWERKGYTIDHCIHWLSGSKPGGSMYRLWQEIGLVRGREIVDLEEFYRYEGEDGRTVVISRDIDKTEADLCTLSPADAPLVKEFFEAARKLAGKDMMADSPPRELMRPGAMAKLLPRMIPYIMPMRKWGKLTLNQVAARFHDPLLAAAFRAMWPPESSAFFMVVTFAWLHEGSAGYPIGGSLPLARNVERRYLELGGEVRYGARVTEILIERARRRCPPRGRHRRTCRRRRLGRRWSRHDLRHARRPLPRGRAPQSVRGVCAAPLPVHPLHRRGR